MDLNLPQHLSDFSPSVDNDGPGTSLFMDCGDLDLELPIFDKKGVEHRVSQVSNSPNIKACSAEIVHGPLGSDSSPADPATTKPEQTLAQDVTLLDIPIARKGTIKSSSVAKTTASSTSPLLLKKASSASMRTPVSDIVHNSLLDHIYFSPTLNADSARESSSDLSASSSPHNSDLHTTPSSQDIDDGASVYDDNEDGSGAASLTSPDTLASWESASHAPAAHSSLPLSPELSPHDKGRLFVRILGLRNVHLPDGKGRNPKFCLSLDNGLERVVTQALPLHSNDAKIDQEFELVVSEGLHFSLTVHATVDPMVPPKSPKEQPAPKEEKRFSGLFGSPKKKTEKKERKPVIQPIDSWQFVLGNEGEFGRCFVDQAQIEADIYGRVQKFNLSLINQWATEFDKSEPHEEQELPAAMSPKKKDKKHQQTNTKVKKTPRIVKRKPYRVGGLQVMLMYVPRRHVDEVLPDSLDKAMEELSLAKQNRNRFYSGFLSQQGGDCSYWRRRWFTIYGTSFVGHHETTKRARFTVDLNGAKLVDYSRDGYDCCLYPDRAFCLLLNNGQKVTFYADTKEEYDEWIKTIGKACKTGKDDNWTDLVFEREEYESSKITGYNQ